MSEVPQGHALCPFPPSPPNPSVIHLFELYILHITFCTFTIFLCQLCWLKTISLHQVSTDVHFSSWDMDIVHIVHSGQSILPLGTSSQTFADISKGGTRILRPYYIGIGICLMEFTRLSEHPTFSYSLYLVWRSMFLKLQQVVYYVSLLSTVMFKKENSGCN